MWCAREVLSWYARARIASNTEALGSRRKSRQRFPVAQQRGERCTEAALGFHEARGALRLQPPLEPLHERTTGGLMVREAFLSAALLLLGLVIRVKHLLERVDHHGALGRKHVFQLAALAPAVRQPVTAHQHCFVRLMACERLGRIFPPFFGQTTPYNPLKPLRL